jgi:hypothetical protein
MAINKKQVSEKIYTLLKGHGFTVQSYDAEGKLTIDPTEATRFVVDKPNLLVRLDLSSETIVLNTSEDLAEHDIRKMLKNLASDYLLNFDYAVFNKTIKAKGENVDIAKSLEKDMADVMEGFGTMTGSSKTSYQPLDNVSLVVKHKKPVNEEVRGSRSRNIHSIFIQRGDERFKLPENNLAMARAVARHVQQGGEVHDDIGTKIIEMAQDLRKLREFTRYVQTSKLVTEANQEFVTLAFENIQQIKDTFKRLSGAKTYEATVGSLELESMELSEDSADIESLFTETHFDDKVANVVNNLKTLSMKKRAYESYITKAAQKESFSNLRDKLSESDALEFASPQAKLAYQVSQLGYTATDQKLGNYLHGISTKLNNGGSLSQFEYGTIKSCLLSASQPKTAAPAANVQSVEESYEQFLEAFDQL